MSQSTPQPSSLQHQSQRPAPQRPAAQGPDPQTAQAPSRPLQWILLQMLIDTGCWALAILLGLMLRYELTYDTINWPGYFAYLALAAAAQLSIGFFAGLYRGKFAYGSFDEVRMLVAVVASVTAVLIAISLFFGLSLGIPRTSGVIAFPFACMFMAGARYLKRMYVESKHRGRGVLTQRVLLVGAGFMGAALVDRMQQDELERFQAVGLIDDDPHKKYLRVSGVPVLGGTEEIAAHVERNRADAVVVALADPAPALLDRLTQALAGSGAQLLRAPGAAELLTEQEPVLERLRPVVFEDLIGRTEAVSSSAEISRLLKGKRVLITGAGGTIGRALAVRAADFGPAEVVLLDQDEAGLQGTQVALSGTGLLTGRETVLADVRDLQPLREAFREHGPQVVFHAAGLKHVSLLEKHPLEAWRTNVEGTANVLSAAAEHGVGTVAVLSSTEAQDPQTVMGHSMLLAERLTAQAAEGAMRAVSVRFGNVVSSRGSVLPLFEEQIRRGGPVTVTDERMERAFTTAAEAVERILQAAAVGADGTCITLPAGKPVRIIDAARRIIDLAGRPVPIVITGLRPGERLQSGAAAAQGDPVPGYPTLTAFSPEPLRAEELDLRRFRSGRSAEPATEALRIGRLPESGADGDTAR